MSTKPQRRRALPAEEWVETKKDATSAELASGGKAPAAVAPSAVVNPEKPKLQPVKQAERVEIKKCGCGGEVIKEPDETKKAEVTLQTDTRPDKTVEPAPEKQGVMLAFWMPEGVAKSLAVEGGLPPSEMHLTLGYFGKLGTDITQDEVNTLAKCAALVAKDAAPMKGTVSGVGRFAASSTSDGKDVVYASMDVPGLSRFRHKLVDEVQKCSGVLKSEIHDFTPHVTMAYVDADAPSPVAKLDRQDVSFTRLVLSVGKERRTMTLGEVEQVSKSMWVPIIKADEERRVTGIVLQPEMVDAQGDIYSEEVIRDAAHAFTMQYNAATKLGLQHSVKPGSPVSQFPKGIHMVESYVTPCEMVINGQTVKKGSWVMTTFIEDDEVWKKLKEGGYKGYSIGGLAKIQRLAEDTATA